jgi:hypothetical protein
VCGDAPDVRAISWTVRFKVALLLISTVGTISFVRFQRWVKRERAPAKTDVQG